ncbi:MAG: bifunctional methylenetetrahydrofolate dehydrogenase/methenyltetrahydrofolate cyclohydrolase FolD [Oligoflexia bacterium]|nr:bifunctional methylenetetrahydrofolate dehydrogenase/methenyltetrahydrofolate cyclohydrolase FolD [Oligoflexia bacterium]
MLLIDGRKVAQKIKEKVATDVTRFKAKYKKAPALAVINVGDDPASAIYLRNKEKSCADVGITSMRFKLDKEKSQEELDALINKLNTDTDVHGILVQLPMPKHFSVEKVLTTLNPLKDADGFHPENLGLLLSGRPRVKPCTPYGIMKMFEHYDISLKGKKVCVVGRSNIVGKPMGILALNADATVTFCHSKTDDLKAHTKAADIVVAAIGKPEFFDSTYFTKNSVVIDVGMHHINGKTCGDVNFSECQNKVQALSPVPGGVGQMTVAMLLQNTLELAFLQEEHKLI